MKLIKKTLEKYNRSLYLYFPEGNCRSVFKRCCLTILREDASEESVQKLLQEGLADFAEKSALILAFPNPPEQGWMASLRTDQEKELAILRAMQDAMESDREIEPAQPYVGIPTYDMMMNTWHLMHDTKYIIGLGSGASMAYALAACAPENIAAVWGIGGNLPEEVLSKAIYEAVPVYLAGAGAKAADYFMKANETGAVPDANGFYRNQVNPLQCVKTVERSMDMSAIKTVWEELFFKVRRSNTGAHGDCEYRMSFRSAGFELFLEDDRLEDGKVHTWFTHVPASVKNNIPNKAPLMLFMHGGSDNPEEAAETSKFHELGEREGFITVYPWSSNKAGWNMKLLDIQDENMDDVRYIMALIHYMLANYPVDEQRVYLSGFSNGAGMAQTVGMLYPERIAAICHIDSNWPGERIGLADFDPEREKPFCIALKKQEKYPYRMPVWYTYGTREPSYPIHARCSQQHQYDFWKRYNNITVKPTPSKDNPLPEGCGVLGDKTERIRPCSLHPHHQYDIQRFYTNDEGHENLYNFVIMRDKGHDVARMDPVLGWNYVKKFKRNADGSVGHVE